MPRPLVTAVVALVAVVAAAGPAGAHAEFEGPQEYPSGSTQRLTVHVPHEKDEGVFNVKVDLYLPSGWTGGCEEVAPWACYASDQTEDGRTVIQWHKDAPAGATPADETFVFSAVVGPPGKAVFPVNQTYSNGEVARWIGDSGADKPAPALTVTPGVAPSTTSSTAADSSSATVSPSTTFSTAAPSPATTQATSATLPGGEGGGGGFPWLVLVTVGAAAGAGGILLVRHRVRCS